MFAQALEPKIDDIYLQAYPHPQAGSLIGITLHDGSSDGTCKVSAANVQFAGCRKQYLSSYLLCRVNGSEG